MCNSNSNVDVTVKDNDKELSTVLTTGMPPVYNVTDNSSGIAVDDRMDTKVTDDDQNDNTSGISVVDRIDAKVRQTKRGNILKRFWNYLRKKVKRN